jgi:hypothetical protein
MNVLVPTSKLSHGTLLSVHKSGISGLWDLLESTNVEKNSFPKWFNQWSISQPLGRMKLCCFQKNGWNLKS